MDSVGMHARDVRSKTRVTVLRRPSGWPRQAVNLLTERLMTQVMGHPMNPSALILMGDFSQEDVEKAIGSPDFYIEKVEGLDNPSLPFKPGVGY